MDSIRIDHAEGALREEGLAFVRDTYHAVFGTNPLDEPDHLFVARRGTKIIGTIGINFWPENSLPRLARIYRFDWTRAPRPVEPQMIAEFGRLIAKGPRLSGALIYAADVFALRHGKTCGWCEHTRPVHRTCVRMGLKFFGVEAELQLDAVDHGDRAFYENNPDVRFYMIDLVHAADVLRDQAQAYIIR